MSDRVFKALLAGTMTFLFLSVVNLAIREAHGSETQYREAEFAPWSMVTAREPSLLPRGQRQFIWSPKVKHDLELVNSLVNAMPYRDDLEGEGTADFWRSRDAGKGWDCEDYAIAKMLMLASWGYPTNAMSIEVGRDRTIPAKNKGHAILRVETTIGPKYLDNRVASVYGDKRKTLRPYYRTYGGDSIIIYPAAK